MCIQTKNVFGYPLLRFSCDTPPQYHFNADLEQHRQDHGDTREAERDCVAHYYAGSEFDLFVQETLTDAGKSLCLTD